MPGCGWPGAPGALQPGRQRPHLLQLGLGGHLLGDEGGLDAVEEPLEPADELGLGDPQLGVAGLLVLEGQGDPLELLDELGGQAVLELGEGPVVDVGEAGPAAVVEGGAAHLLEQLLDHRADAHHLRGVLDEVGRTGVALPPPPSSAGLLAGGVGVARGHAHPLAG